MDDDTRAHRSHLEWGRSPLEDVVMSSYLLLHGAWHGAWCWDQVRRPLEAAGHSVHTPTFAGVGERAVELARHPRPRIGLDHHIGDITSAIWQRDLWDLTVVAHSYAGVPLCGALPLIARRVRHLVFLDAFYPLPQYPSVAAMLTVRHPPAWLQRWRAQLLLDVALSHPVPPPPLRFLGITDPNDAQRVEARLTKMPLQFVDGRRRFSPPPDDRCIYIWCSGSGEDMGEGFAPYARQAQVRGWRYFEIDTGHDAMITAPNLVASILDSIGASRKVSV
jgi:hypothetical protein